MNRHNPFEVAAAPPRRPIVRRQPQAAPAPRAVVADPAARPPRSKHWRFRHAEFEIARASLDHLESIRDASQALERHLATVVERGEPQPVVLSPAAFSLIADVRQLGDWLFDKQQVDARSVVDKFSRAANLRFRDTIVQRLAGEGLIHPQALVLQATDAGYFEARLGAPMSHEVYLELQRRAGLLIEAEWAIAHDLEAHGAEDWPPRPGSAKPAGQNRSK